MFVLNAIVYPQISIPIAVVNTVPFPFLYATCSKFGIRKIRNSTTLLMQAHAEWTTKKTMTTTTRNKATHTHTRART